MAGSTYFSGLPDNHSANKPIYLSWKLGCTKAGDSSEIIWTKATVRKYTLNWYLKQKGNLNIIQNMYYFIKKRRTRVRT